MCLRCILLAMIVLPILLQPGNAGALDCWSQPGCYICTVVRHIDGDTLGVQCASGDDAYTGPLRLSGIDTPETGDRAKCDAEREKGKAAAFYMSTLAGVGSSIQVLKLDVDRYGRWVGMVRKLRCDRQLDCVSVDLGATLVWEGHAKPWAWRTPKPNWCE